MGVKNNVDNTKKLSVVEWFTGYGGNELGLKRVIPNMQPVAFCEREAFVVANLVSKMEAGLLDSVPIWSDVTTFPIEPFKDRVGLFIASYPCQPFSAAGKRGGADDSRHLWPACRRFINGARPSLVWLENVEGHVSLGLSTVLADLEEDGYCAAWGIFSASEVGAPHQRKRVFILAYDKCKGLERPAGSGVQGNSEGLTSGHRDELALGNSIGCSHREPQEQPTERGVDALGNAGAGGREDVAHHHHQVLQGLRERCGQTLANGHNQHGHNENTGGDSQKSGVQEEHRTEQLCHREFGRADEGRTESVWPSRPGASQYGWEPPRTTGWKTLSELGLHSDGSSDQMGAPLTDIPLMGYNKLRGEYATQKTCAYKILRELRNFARTEGLQWTAGRLWSFLAEEILQSGLQRDVLPQKVCYFIWASITGNKVEGKELPEMWFTKTSWDSPRRQESCEQFARELDYALCVLSYEIALERGQEALESTSEMCGVREWCEKAWILSETLAEDSEVWKSTFNEESWANRAYFEAAGLGANRTDELRMLGNGVVPATAEKAFRVLYAELKAQTERTNSAPAEMESCRPQQPEPLPSLPQSLDLPGQMKLFEEEI